MCVRQYAALLKKGQRWKKKEKIMHQKERPHLSRHLKMQLRRAADVRFYSALTLIAFLIILVSSVFFQEMFLSQRNTGRDIHTHTNLAEIDTARLNQLATLYFLEGPSDDNTNQLIANEYDLTVQHAYLASSGLNDKNLHVFLQSETTYSFILATINHILKYHLPELSTTIVQFNQAMTNYLEMLNTLFSNYTQILATNNATTGFMIPVMTGIELLILCVLAGTLLFPTLHQFSKSMYEYADIQAKEATTRQLNQRILREMPATVYELRTDVVCIGVNQYQVAGIDQPYIVNYDPVMRTFSCHCVIYTHTKTCLHTRRAKWLHNTLQTEQVSA